MLQRSKALFLLWNYYRGGFKTEMNLLGIIAINTLPVLRLLLKNVSDNPVQGKESVKHLFILARI